MNEMIATLVQKIKDTPLTRTERRQLTLAVKSAPRATSFDLRYCKRKLHMKTAENVGSQGECIPCRRESDRRRYAQAIGREPLAQPPTFGDHETCDPDGVLCDECAPLLEVGA